MIRLQLQLVDASSIRAAERAATAKIRRRIHTVSATSVDLGVAMPSGYPHSRAVRWRLFDQVCLGVPLWRAAQDMGVSTTVASIWWRNAGAMKLGRGRGGGVADAGNMSLPGGQGHRLSLDERIVIMRGLDAGLSHAEIGDRIATGAPSGVK
jgi:hypothetical protein